MLDAYVVQINDIEFTVKNKPLQNVSDATSAQAAWNTPAKRYEGKGKQRGVHLIKESSNNRFLHSIDNNGIYRLWNPDGECGLPLQSRRC